MTPIILKYPFDYTGVDPNNLVLGEEHTMVRRNVRAVATNHGPFFTKGLKVYDARYPTVPLVAGEAINGGQYVAAELYAEATKRTGKEICAVIVITDQNVGDNIVIDYQVVGGEFSSSVQVIADLVATLQLDDRPVKWGDILGLPDGFTPAHHLHDLGDVYGFEYVVDALERVRQAILLGDVASHDEIYRYVDHYMAGFQQQVAVQQQQLDAHKSDRANPHFVTKVQVGLGSVDNFPTASVAEAVEGVVQNRFMTPYATRQAIWVFAELPLHSHMGNTANPHQTTKLQVGLGNVEDFPVATVTEAVEGTATNRYMTPYMTRQSVWAFAGQQIVAHTGDFQNPHQTTKVQVGLGNVQDFPLASDLEAVSATANNRYMTPYLTRQTVYVFAEIPLANHIANGNNPHNVTKVQVGLGNVDNYPMATVPEALGGVALNRFMSPYMTRQTVYMFAEIPLANHINDKQNPHNVTKAQVGLWNVENYPVAGPSDALAGGTTNYMTPWSTRYLIDNAYWPIVDSHVGNRNNPHGVTAEQTGAYTQAQVNWLVNQRLPIGGTAVNSNAFAGFDWTTAYHTIRANLVGGLITSGIVASPFLGSNYTGAWSDVLCSDNVWRPFKTVYEGLGLNTASAFWCGRTTNANAMATYSGKPAGTIIVVQVGVPTEVGTGNGSYWTTYWYNYTWIKTSAGNEWQQLTTELHVATD